MEATFALLQGGVNALLPARTWTQFTEYAASASDTSPLRMKVASRRWAWENLISLSQCILAATLLVASAADCASTLVLHGFDLAALLQACTAAWLAYEAATAFYASSLANILGTKVDPPSEVPRTQLQEVRRPRFVVYKMRLRARMHLLRVWWLWRGLLTLAAVALLTRRAWLAAPPAVTPAAEFPFIPGATDAMSAHAQASAHAAFMRTGRALAPLATAAGEGLSAAAALSATGLASLVDGALTAWAPGFLATRSAPAASVSGGARAVSPALAWAAKTAAAAATRWSAVSAAPATVVARQALQVLAFIVAPLALAAIATFSLAACSAADFSGAMTPKQQQWAWPAGQRSSHPAQTQPHRMARPEPVSLAALHHDMRDHHQHRTPEHGSPVATNPAPSTPGSPLAAFLSPTRKSSSSSSSASAPTTPSGAATTTPARAGTPAIAIAPAAVAPGGEAAPSAAVGGAGVVPAIVPPAPRAFPDSTSLLDARPLRIVILTLGTRGDVQPFVALGRALREAGHSVIISSTSDFRDFVEERGLVFADTKEPRIAQPESWLKVNSVAEMIKESSENFKEGYDRVADGFADACTTPARADLIIGTAMTVTFALSIAEALSTPVWIAKLAPELPSRAFTTPGSIPTDCGILNLAICYKYWIGVALASTAAGLDVKENAWRKRKLGLGPVDTSTRVEQMTHSPQLLGFSSNLFPKPTDYPEWAFQTGFWFTSESEHWARRVDPALRAFMTHTDPETKAPARFAVVTFGSMVLAARPTLVPDIVDELLRFKYHVLVLTGWSTPPQGLARFAGNPRVMCHKEAPHDWLFPLASLVVHHGGAGTTGRALASGVPSIVIPVLRFADQMQWGALLEERGVGVLIREKNPSPAAIAAAVRKVNHREDRVKAPWTLTAMGDRANALGSVVRAETSAETALALLESCLCNQVLTPAEADAIHPLAGPLAAADGAPVSLTPAQRMCLRNCVPCRRLRAQLQLADTSLFRIRDDTVAASVAAATVVTPAVTLSSPRPGEALPVPTVSVPPALVAAAPAAASSSGSASAEASDEEDATEAEASTAASDASSSEAETSSPPSKRRRGGRASVETSASAASAGSSVRRRRASSGSPAKPAAAEATGHARRSSRLAR